MDDPALGRLQEALVNADKSGDTAAATALAKEIRNRQLLLSALPGSQTTVPAWLPNPSVDPEHPSPMASMGRGFMDIGQGAKQRYLQITGSPDAAQYTHDVTQEQQRYEKGAGPGFDLWRTAGQAAAVAPLTGLLAAASPVAGLGGAMAAGAEQGMYQGALNFTPEGRSPIPQMVAGTLSGGTAPVASTVVGKVLARGADLGRTGLQRLTTSPDDIVAAIKPALAQRGLDWDQLSANVRSNLFDQARRQMSIDGNLSPDALARKLQMDQVLGPNAGPTMAQVTRDPAQWSRERNLQKLQANATGDTGPSLTDRYQDQVQRLQDRLRQIVASTGGQSQSDYQAGLSATNAVQQKMADSGKVVDDLYSAWRQSGAGGTEVKAAPIADTLGRVADEFGTENIPAAVQARMRDFGLLGGKQTKLLTIDEAEKLRKLIGNNDPGSGPASKVSQILKSSVDNAVMDTQTPELPQLQAARRAAFERFSMRDSAPAVTAAADADNAPDRFFKRYILNGDVRDLQGLKSTLNTTATGQSVPPGFLADPANPASGALGASGSQAWKDLKGQTLEYVMSKATSAGEDTFSGKAFRKALNEIGEERLKVLFTPEELQKLRTLDSVAYDLTAEPNLSAVNHSNTAPTAGGYIGQASKAIAPRVAELAANWVPGLGKVVAGAWQAGDQMAQDAALRQAVGQALTGAAADPANAVARRMALARLIRDQVSPFAVAGGTAGVLSLGQ